jgi:plasmid stabilization system protein ParE
MNRRLRVTPRAEQHLAAALRWHEAQAPGLGERFLTAVDRRMVTIEQFPEAWPLVYGDYHRALLKPFQFGIFYRIEPETIVVVGILDLRRNPDGLYRELLS